MLIIKTVKMMLPDVGNICLENFVKFIIPLDLYIVG